MKLPCSVVQDLLPLYHDNVCSENSSALIEEHLKDCPACQEEFHKLDGLPLAQPLLEEETHKSQGLKKVKRTLRRRWVKIGIAALVAVIFLGFVGNIVMRMPLLSQPIESVKGISVENDRLVLEIVAPGGIGYFPAPITENSTEDGTLLVFASVDSLENRLNHFLWGGGVNYNAMSYFTPLTPEAYVNYGNEPFAPKRELDKETEALLYEEAESSFPGGDVVEAYYYTGNPLKWGDQDYVLSHLEDQCTLIWTTEDGAVYP